MSFLVLTAMINSLGLIASASVGVVEKLIVFSMLPTTAFSAALSAMDSPALWRRPDEPRPALYAPVCRAVPRFRDRVPAPLTVERARDGRFVYRRPAGCRAGRAVPALLQPRLCAGLLRLLHECVLQRRRAYAVPLDSQPCLHLPGTYSIVMAAHSRGAPIHALYWLCGACRFLSLCTALPVVYLRTLSKTKKGGGPQLYFARGSA